MDRDQRDRILRRGKPATLWEGEPLLGSIYGEEEIEAAVSAMRVAQNDVTKCPCQGRVRPR